MVYGKKPKYIPYYLFLLGLLINYDPKSYAEINLDKNIQSATIINGIKGGNCITGNCIVSGGDKNGANIFHRFNSFDTRSAINSVLFKNENYKNVIVGVSSSKGSFINKPISLSKKGNLFWVSPGGINIGNGVDFINTSQLHLSTANSLHFSNGVFDVFSNRKYHFNQLDSNPLIKKEGFKYTQSNPNKIGNISLSGINVSIDENLYIDALDGNIAIKDTTIKTTKNIGGEITVLGKEIKIEGSSKLISQGDKSGGLIQIGGSWQNTNPHVRQALYTEIGEEVSFNASAIDHGNGGEIVIWSDIKNPLSLTKVSGTFNLEGGLFGGDGGRLETSAANLDLGENISVKLGSNFGNSGKWLIDPEDYIIDNKVAKAIKNALKTGNVKIKTSGCNTNYQFNGCSGNGDGDIKVNSSIDFSSSSRLLTLNAASQVIINSDIDSGSGGLSIIAPDGFTGTGTIKINPTSINALSGNISVKIDKNSTYSGEIKGSPIGSSDFLTTGSGTLLFTINPKNFTNSSSLQQNNNLNIDVSESSSSIISSGGGGGGGGVNSVENTSESTSSQSSTGILGNLNIKVPKLSTIITRNRNVNQINRRSSTNTPRLIPSSGRESSSDNDSFRGRLSSRGLSTSVPRIGREGVRINLSLDDSAIGGLSANSSSIPRLDSSKKFRGGSPVSKRSSKGGNKSLNRNKKSPTRVIAPSSNILEIDAISNLVKIESLIQQNTAKNLGLEKSLINNNFNTSDIQKALNNAKSNVNSIPAMSKLFIKNNLYASNSPSIELKTPSIFFEPNAYNPAIMHIRFTKASGKTTAENTDSFLDITLIPSEGEVIGKRVELSMKEFGKNLGLLYSQLSRQENLKVELESSPSRVLNNMIFESIKTDLERLKVTTLLISADRGLQAIPYAALHDGENYFGDSYAFSLTPSLGLTDISVSDSEDKKLLAIGASEFKELAPLPLVGQELSKIGGTKSKEIVFNKEFTPESFFEKAIQEKYDMIHIATHAEFKPGGPNASRLFSGTTPITLDNFSILRKGRIGNPLDLVVFSACRTALGDPETELGFSGLALQAGAKSAIGTLWYVDDVMTSAYFVQMYKFLDLGIPKAEAMQLTRRLFAQKLITLEDDKLIGFNNLPLLENLTLSQKRLIKNGLNNPFFWAGIELMGSPW